MNLIAILYTIIIAFLAGAIGAMLGLGGGSILVPFLDILVDQGILEGVTFREIIATSLVCTVTTASTSSSIYIKRGITNIRLGIFLGLISIIGVFTGATIMTLIPSNFLRMLFGILLTYTAFNMIKRRQKKSVIKITNGCDKVAEYLGLNGSYFDEAENKEIKYNVRNSIKGLLLSFFGGLLAGLLGIGGGVILVPIMVIILNVPQKVASATSLFIIGLNGATGGIVYLISGLINPYLVSASMIGIIMGATVGTKFLRKLRNETLRRIFGFFLIYLALRMILKGLSII